jgi:hypothetical protein
VTKNVILPEGLSDYDLSGLAGQGLFITQADTWTEAFDSYLAGLGVLPPVEEYQGCECEIDWNCPLHGGTSRPTFEERRYQGLDDEEARYYGALA